MFQRITESPVAVPTRKERRAAQMAGLLKETQDLAIEVSGDLTAGKTAFVYLAVIPGQKFRYVFRLSRFPETTLPDFPGSSLKLVAGFQKGRKVLG